MTESVQELLAVTDQDFRVLIEQMNDGFGIQDENGILTYVNDSLCRMLEYAPEELIGRRVVDLIHEDSLVLYQQRSSDRREGKSARYEHDMVTKSGARISVLASAQPLLDEDGEFRGTFAVITDVTERKRAGEALRESKERYRGLFEAAFDALVVHEGGVILDANPAFERMTGQPLADLVGKYLPDLAPREEQRRLYVELLGSAVGKPFEMTGEKPDGEYFALEMATKEHTYRGRPAMVTAVRDITARKQAEEALQSARDLLEGKIERTMVERNPYGLTFREFTVLHHLAAGKADKEIAAELVISPLTVHKHVANILAKMDASSRTEAGVRALREGLLD